MKCLWQGCLKDVTGRRLNILDNISGDMTLSTRRLIILIVSLTVGTDPMDRDRGKSGHKRCMTALKSVRHSERKYFTEEIQITVNRLTNTTFPLPIGENILFCF